jgi:hypothetical protein
MPAWIRVQPPAQIPAARLEGFVTMRESGVMAFPRRPAAIIVEAITGQTRDQIADAGSRS